MASNDVPPGTGAGPAAPEPCGILFVDSPRRVCGNPSDGAYRGTCECGHVNERPLCPGHAEKAHMCTACFYDGHACDIALTLLDRAAMPGQPYTRPCCDHCNNGEGDPAGHDYIPGGSAHDGPCEQCAAERARREHDEETG